MTKRFLAAVLSLALIYAPVVAWAAYLPGPYAITQITGLTSGNTSGGVVYFNTTTTVASSGILNSNIIVKGGGAGGAPTNSSITDNGTTVSSSEALNWSGNATLGGTITLSATVTSGSVASCLGETSAFLVITTACGGGLVLASTGISGTGNGTNNILYQASGALLGEIASAASSVFVTNGSSVPSFSTTLPSGLAATNLALTTPTLGAATATSIDGLTITTTTGTLTIASGKTLTDTSGEGAVLLLGATGGGFAAYAGAAACSSGAFLTALSTAGAETCTTLTSAMLPTGTLPTAVEYTTSNATVALAATNNACTLFNQTGTKATVIDLPASPAANTIVCIKDDGNAFQTNDPTIKTTDSSTIERVTGTTGLAAPAQPRSALWLLYDFTGTNWNAI